MRFLVLLVAATLFAIFLAYPPFAEQSDGECSALDQRYAGLGSHDAAGRLTVSPLYGSSSSSPSGAAFVRDRYPALPPTLGCALAYWKSMLNPAAFGVPAAQAGLPPEAPPSPAADQPARGIVPTIARDITPNGDPISPASIFTLPMDAVAVRVDYPGGVPGKAARFELLQGRKVIASCRPETSAPKTAWCAFNVSLRKGSYAISFALNNVPLGQFPFTVIGR